MHAKVQRIQCVGDTFNRAAFAAGIPAFKGKNGRNPFIEGIYLQLAQPFLVFPQLHFIFILGNILV